MLANKQKDKIQVIKSAKQLTSNLSKAVIKPKFGNKENSTNFINQKSNFVIEPKLLNKILKAKNIALFSHSSPDPDALGSLSAMAQTLSAAKKNVTIFIQEPVFNTFSFLVMPNIAHQLSEQNILNFDLFISLDTSTSKLLGKFENAFLAHKNNVSIDHHASRTPFTENEIINTSAASNCEIIFDLLNQLKLQISPNVATALLTGIIGDTGRFLHSSTSALTFSTASALLNLGANINLINNQMFKNSSLDYLKAQKIMLEHLDIHGNIAVSFLKQKDYKKAKISLVSGSELVNIIANISFIDIAVVLTEQTDGKINVSLRSRENYDISIIAQQFGGGGHKQASGIRNLAGGVEKIKKELLDYIKQHIEELKN